MVRTKPRRPTKLTRDLLNYELTYGFLPSRDPVKRMVLLAAGWAERADEQHEYASRWSKQSVQREKARPLCGAKMRAGHPCQAKCVPGKTKCRMHGGLSTGPKTAAGRAAIAESNRRRALQKKAG